MKVAGDGQNFFGFGPDAEIGVSFGEDYFSLFGNDVSGGQWQAPALVAVDEGDVDEDGEVIVAVVFGDGVDEAEFFGDGVAEIGKHGEWKAVLVSHEVALTLDLRTNGHHEGIAFAELAV